MMKRIDEFKVGLLVISGFILIFTANWLIKGVRIDKGGYVVYAAFESLGGLSQGADIRLADGLRIGTVQEIQISNQKPVLKLYIKKRYRLTTGARITIASTSIIGEKFVSVTAKPGGGPPLKSGMVIQGKTPLSLMDSLQQFGQLMKNLNKMVTGGSGKGLLDSLNQAVNDTGNIVNNMLRRSSGQLSASLESAKNAAGSADQLLRELHKTRKLADQLLLKMQPVADTLSQQLPGVLSKFDRLLGSLNNSLNRGQGLIPKLLNDKKLFYDMKFILENLKRFTFQLRKNPSSLIWKKR